MNIFFKHLSRMFLSSPRRLLFSVVAMGGILLSTHPFKLYADDLKEELEKAIATLDEKAQSQVQKDRLHSTEKARTNVQNAIADVERRPEKREPDPAKKIVVYMRAKSGVGFPSRDQVVMEPIPPAVKPTPLTGENYPKLLDRPVKHPVRCPDSGTVKIDRNLKGEDDSKMTFDVLYVPEAFVPLDPSEVYGASVDMHPFGPTSDESVYRLMQMDSVPCLPYRIRHTDNFEFFDRGNNALKNYDKKPTGPGEFHPWVQERLFKAPK